MDKEARKAATAAYKERKTIGGVYLIRCTATGETWVGQWADLETVQTRHWFNLRQGSHPNKSLQTAWRDHGAEQFCFEVLEQLDIDGPYADLVAARKKRAAHWRETLHAHLL